MPPRYDLPDLSKSKTLFKVGDVEGHIIGITLRRGLNFINDIEAKLTIPREGWEVL